MNYFFFYEYIILSFMLLLFCPLLTMRQISIDVSVLEGISQISNDESVHVTAQKNEVFH